MKKLIVRLKAGFCVFFVFFLISSDALAQSKKIRVVCLGNSITYGAGIVNRLRDAYPSVLERMIGSNYEVMNLGHSGATLLKRGNIPYWSLPEYQQAKTSNADIVIIKLGTNDTKEVNKPYWNDLQTDLSALVDTLRLLPSNPKIYVCIPVPVFIKESSGISDSILRTVVLPQIRKVILKKQTEVIDLREALISHPELFPDGVHPNEAGDVIIAQTIAKRIANVTADFVPQSFPGKKSSWNGYDRYDFNFLGRDVIVVEPKEPLPGKPWVVRPAFFGAFAQADIQLLKKGMYVCFFDVTHFYGSERSQELFSGFYKYMVGTCGLSTKVTLEGFSRGGLFAQNWAMNNPDKVACIYLDAPVSNIKSWPGRKDKDLWNSFLNEYKISDSQADTLPCSPVDNVTKLVKSMIPILNVCGDADKVVPLADNTMIVRDKITLLGGSMRLITKPGVDHHPHSLENPEPIVDFILQHQSNYQKKQHINLRGTLNNSRIIFETEKKGRVAFLGGSITEMDGWRNMVMELLKQRFPHTEFEFINAGLSSTGSTPGAFRLKSDVLSHGKIDLLFVDATVNDYTNGFDSIAQIRGVEGEIRQALLSNPYMDIIMQYFICDSFIFTFASGKQPTVILNHEKVANYYQIPSINQAHEIAERMQAGEITWEQFGGTHPAQLGHKYYAASVDALLDKMWSTNYSLNGLVAHSIPLEPMDKYSYFNAALVSPLKSRFKKGWKYMHNWHPVVKGEVRKQFVNGNYLETLTPGSEVKFSFEGSAVGIYCLAGPNAGIIEYKVDNMPYKQLDLFTAWSSYLYLPWMYILASELSTSKHTLHIRMTQQHNEKSKGTACLIYYFAVNQISIK